MINDGTMSLSGQSRDLQTKISSDRVQCSMSGSQSATDGIRKVISVGGRSVPGPSVTSIRSSND